MPIDYLPLLPALCLCAAAIFGFCHRGSSPFFLRAAEWLAVAALVFVIAIGIAGSFHGPMTSGLIGVGGIGFSCRIDILSVTVGGLVAFIGWVVLRYAGTYLEGERRHSTFMGWLALTLAAVLLFVFAGNLVQLVLAWIATSLFLHRLLLFYPNRIGARRAANKKFIMARLGDAALILAALHLGLAHDTLDLDTILASTPPGQGQGGHILAAWLLSLAALLKSAQFPTHGWLIEMMETPTPVSALLHAGVINAGGYLLMRFAGVLVDVPHALAFLAMVGGFTALFGAVVMQTQPLAKTALAWSTVSQMGFMILECGLGLFPLALLHLVTHTLYKAHSFLSVGNRVAEIAAQRRAGAPATARPRHLIPALFLALALYGGIDLILIGGPEASHAAGLASVTIFAMTSLFAQGFANAAPGLLAARIAGYALLYGCSDFVFQTAAHWATRDLFPPPPYDDGALWAIALLCATSFGTLTLAQILLPHWAHHPRIAALRVHLSNGLYVTAWLDRLVGGWRIGPYSHTH